MSKWREPTDAEKLEMFKAKLNNVDVQPQYYRAADSNQPARMESGAEEQTRNNPSGVVQSTNFCAGCGAKKSTLHKFCPECGASMPTGSGGGSDAPSTQSAIKSYEANAPKSKTVDPALGVTGSVRAYTASASDAEKEKKYGQQKWGLFETNYQRTKGITTDQSLDEIDNFATGNYGRNQGAAGSAGGGGSAGGKFSGGGGGGGSSASCGSAGYGSSSAGQAGSRGDVEVTTEVRGGGGGGPPSNFTSQGSQGASALDQYKKQQAAKFAPGAGGGSFK